ncbi:MAG: phosphate acyltransferase PlsX [Spirochaetes bacterium]|nr:phosphate acyltransferase PlsX [Spirochaetota bacterium]
MAKIAVDVMSGDRQPEVIIDGCLLYINKTNDDLAIIGDKKKIEKYLNFYPYERKKIEVIQSSEIIKMDDNPLTSYKEKQDSSIVIGTKLLKEKKIAGFFSPGNTGAVVTSCLFEVGRIKGIKRPALAAILPNSRSSTILIDAGANVDCKPYFLFQFAIMGHIFSEKILKKTNPKIGLLSNGEEEQKGNSITKEAYKLLSKSDLNFIGNIEGYNIVDGSVDIVVSDGFFGNIALKSIEGTAKAIMTLLKLKIKESFIATLGGLLIKNSLLEIKEMMDPREYGGAPLLGINGEVIIGHGNSDEIATYNGLRMVKRMSEVGVNNIISKYLKEKLNILNN